MSAVINHSLLDKRHISDIIHIRFTPYTRKPFIDMLTLIAGPVGAGKTTLANILATTRHNTVIIDKEDATQPLTDATLTALGHRIGDRHSYEYETFVRPRAYGTLSRIIHRNCIYRSNMIVTAPFTHEITNNDLIHSTIVNPVWKKYRMNTFIIYVTCDDDVRHQRLVGRGSPADTWILENWDEHVSRVPHVDDVVADAIIDTTFTLDTDDVIRDISLLMDSESAIHV